MKLYLDKTKIIVFYTLRRHDSWSYDGEEVNAVTFYKYLGQCLHPDCACLH